MTQDHNDIIYKLSLQFPKCFFDEAKRRVPLKKNIITDIEKLHIPEFEGNDLQAAIEWYQSHYYYHKCAVVAGTPRIDLDGVKVGTVTPQEANFHQDEIIRINNEKAARGIPNPHDADTAFPTKKQSALMQRSVENQLTDEELLKRARNKLARIEPILLGDDDDGLRATMTAPLLKSAIDDLKAIAARLQ
jgi:sRNA-binding protein